MTEKTRLLVIFGLRWGSLLARFADVFEVYFRAPLIEEKTFFFLFKKTQKQGAQN